MIEQRILDALHEQPATKLELMDVLGAREGTIATALRRMALAKEVLMIQEHRGAPALYKPLVERTALQPTRGPSVTITPAQPWKPSLEARPDWLRRGEA